MNTANTKQSEQSNEVEREAVFTGEHGSADAPDFISELRSLINKYSMENWSNTPDFILAQYLTDCLLAWNQATQQRETWYGRDARPTWTPNTQ